MLNFFTRLRRIRCNAFSRFNIFLKWDVFKFHLKASHLKKISHRLKTLNRIRLKALKKLIMQLQPCSDQDNFLNQDLPHRRTWAIVRLGLMGPKATRATF